MTSSSRSLLNALSIFGTAVLYGVSPLDPATFAALSAFVALVALAACLVPARQAAAGDPLEALRDE